MVMRRRVSLNEPSDGSSVLPSEYQQVEWIAKTSSGNLYFDTGIEVASRPLLNGYSVDISAEVSSPVNNHQVCCTFLSSSSQAGCYIGSIYAGRVSMVGDQYISANEAFSSNIICADRHDYHIYWTDSAMFAECEGETATRSFSTAVAKQTIVIGSGQVTNNVANSYKIYGSVIVKKDGQAVRNMIPCYRKSDTKIGYYDTITDSFITQTGNATAEKGADV